MVLRVYVQRKSGFEGEAKALLKEVKDLLGITELQRIDLLNRYDVEGISEELFESCIPTVFFRAAVRSCQPYHARVFF